MIFQLITFLSLFFPGDSLLTPYEKSNKTKTTTHAECIQWYMELAIKYPEVKVITGETTDCGKALNLVVINTDKAFTGPLVVNSKKAVLFINNGIHPGEPEGIDASMMLARDLVSKAAYRKLLDSVIVCIVPIFNIDGSLNTSKYYRVNQNGPENPAFRGNAQNRDLNRDFIKCDTRNTKALIRFIQAYQPDVFIDTHTSNGADYQYTMTYIATQKDKLHPLLATYMTQQFQPLLDEKMKKKGFPLSPYVNERKSIPDSGIVGFLETPRYSTGYTTLFNTIGFVSETHMLKAFDKRVDATYHFLASCIELMGKDAEKIKRLRKDAAQATIKATAFPINYSLDTSNYSLLNFKGYEAAYKTSEVSNLPRLYYDKTKPFTKKVPFYNHYIAQDTVKKPLAYMIPQAYASVIRLLQENGVRLRRLSNDTLVTAEVYYISDYKTGSNPFEGHYLHSATKIRKTTQKTQFYAGDYRIDMNQTANRFIVEVLEPQSVDSYFNWNYFDGILGQKEYFSDYVFEDVAADLLKQEPALRESLEEAKKKDAKLATSAAAQLDFVYRHSAYYEPSHKRYPVVRIF